MDAAGNLYGTTCCGAGTTGTVFELSPSGGGWAFNLLPSSRCRPLVDALLRKNLI